jgi:hypothetical protein
MIIDAEFGKMWEEVVVGYFMVTFQYFPGGTEKNHEQDQGSQFLCPDLIPGISKYNQNLFILCGVITSGWTTDRQALTYSSEKYLKLQDLTIATIKP